MGNSGFLWGGGLWLQDEGRAPRETFRQMPFWHFWNLSHDTVNLFNNKHTGRRKIHAHPLREAARSRGSSWGLERPESSQVPASLARTLWAGTTARHASCSRGWRRGAHVRRHLPGELVHDATGWTVSRWVGSQEELVPFPLFGPGITKDTADMWVTICWGHVAGWWDTVVQRSHSHTVWLQNNLPVSFLWPPLCYAIKLCGCILWPGDNAGLLVSVWMIIPLSIYIPQFLPPHTYVIYEQNETHMLKLTVMTSTEDWHEESHVVFSGSFWSSWRDAEEAEYSNI